MATESFRKIPQNRFGMAFVTPQKKVLRGIPSLRMEENTMKKLVTKNPALANRTDSMFLSKTCFGTEFREFASMFFSTEWNSEHFSPLWNGSERNSESFLFRGLVQNRFPRVCFYFCSVVQSSEHSSPLQNGSERNSESFLFRGTAGIPPEQTNCSVYSVLHGIIFLSEIANSN